MQVRRPRLGLLGFILTGALSTGAVSTGQEIFSGGFEIGSTCAWSAAQPAEICRGVSYRGDFDTNNWRFSLVSNDLLGLARQTRSLVR